MAQARPTPAASQVPLPAGLSIDRPDDPATALRLCITGDLTSVADMRDAVLTTIASTGHGHIEIDLTGLVYRSSSGVSCSSKRRSAPPRPAGPWR